MLPMTLPAIAAGSLVAGPVTEGCSQCHGRGWHACGKICPADQGKQVKWVLQLLGRLDSGWYLVVCSVGADVKSV